MNHLNEILDRIIGFWGGFIVTFFVLLVLFFLTALTPVGLGYFMHLIVYILIVALFFVLLVVPLLSAFRRREGMVFSIILVLVLNVVGSFFLYLYYKNKRMNP